MHDMLDGNRIGSGAHFGTSWKIIRVRCCVRLSVIVVARMFNHQNAISLMPVFALWLDVRFNALSICK